MSAMNIEKAQKRLAKLHNRGDHGYPRIDIEYCAGSDKLVNQVKISLRQAAEGQVFTETFTSQGDVRLDETVQTTLLKIIDRADVKTVFVN
jgi:hypothetical protein